MIPWSGWPPACLLALPVGSLGGRSTIPGVVFEPFIGLAAVVGALFAFAGLLQAGLYVVKWLKLPQDLPEGAYFSPPAPPIADSLTPAQAQARAQGTAALRRLHVMAHLAQRAAVFCSEAVAIAPAERRPVLVALAEQAKTAAEGADAARKADPVEPAVVRGHLRAALTARREARAAVADCVGDDSARRRRLMLMLVALVVLWVASMLLILLRR